MKTLAYYALHYGKEYLAWSIRSIQDAVDEIHVLYTDRPSFGHGTPLRCPETEQQLKDEAHKFLKKPLHWHKGDWAAEGAHRDTIYTIAKSRGVNTILVVDADEVWKPEDAAYAVETAHTYSARSLLVPFVHFYRSFDWICNDPCVPVRILNADKPAGTSEYFKADDRKVLHFGYAQSESLTRYKQSCHGHKAEWRSNWFKEKFLEWKPGVEDVHPTNRENFWKPVQTDEKTKSVVESTLKDHPYYGVPIIR